MSKLNLVFNEKKFLKEMNNLTKTIIVLINSNDSSAYDYQLCFYASMIGFIKNAFPQEKDVNELLAKYINHDILNDLNRHICSDSPLNEKNSSSIYYCYNKALNIRYHNSEYVLKKLLKMHLNITQALSIQEDLRRKKRYEKILDIMNKN